MHLSDAFAASMTIGPSGPSTSSSTSSSPGASSPATSMQQRLVWERAAAMQRLSSRPGVPPALMVTASPQTPVTPAVPPSSKPSASSSSIAPSGTAQSYTPGSGSAAKPPSSSPPAVASSAPAPKSAMLPIGAAAAGWLLGGSKGAMVGGALATLVSHLAKSGTAPQVAGFGELTLSKRAAALLTIAKVKAAYESVGVAMGVAKTAWGIWGWVGGPLVGVNQNYQIVGRSIEVWSSDFLDCVSNGPSAGNACTSPYREGALASWEDWILFGEKLVSNIKSYGKLAYDYNPIKFAFDTVRDAPDNLRKPENWPWWAKAALVGGTMIVAAHVAHGATTLVGAVRRR